MQDRSMTPKQIREHHVGNPDVFSHFIQYLDNQPIFSAGRVSSASLDAM